MANEKYLLRLHYPTKHSKGQMVFYHYERNLYFYIPYFVFS